MGFDFVVDEIEEVVEVEDADLMLVTELEDVVLEDDCLWQVQPALSGADVMLSRLKVALVGVCAMIDDRRKSI